MAKIQLRRDTTANWELVDPILADGEQGFEKDTGKIKIGDGSTVWTLLPYQGATALADLTDVTMVGSPSPVVDDGLVWDGTKWANKPVATKEELAANAGDITTNYGYF